MFKENVNIEKCLCGNELTIEWYDGEKFKMVRCPNCNNELKFKNPNLSELTLDELITNISNGDIFWKTSLTKFFNSLINKDEKEKIVFLKKLSRSKELFNDFTKEMINSTDCEQLYEKYINKISINLVCPSCGEKLTFMMPDGKTLHCNKCNKYYKNENNAVGDETSSPYSDNNVLY